jgi:hypothetical protein
VPTLSWKQGTWDSERALYILYSLSDSLFSYFLEKEAISFWAAFSRLVPSYSHKSKVSKWQSFKVSKRRSGSTARTLKL